jgi:hypothetical protein
MADSPALDDGIVRRYLLGRASARESNEVEDLYFGDPELFERLEEQDDALTHEYLGGGLSEAERADFERTLKSMPRRRERLALIHQLQHRATRHRTQRWFRVPESVISLLGIRSDGSGLSIRGLAAACAVLAITSVWLGVSVMRLRGDIRQVTTVRESVQRELATARDALARERASTPSAGRSGTPPDSASTSIIALTLIPGLLRDGSVPTVSVPNDALVLRMRLVLPVADAQRYRASLRTPAEQERWSQVGLAAVRAGSANVINVDLPVTALEPGQFILLVTPTDSSSAASERYHFAVVR